jgi:hypothetical protein
MDSAAPRLKAMRQSCRPAMSIRDVAAQLGMAPSSYAFYEDANKFKKRFLPIELAQALVSLFTARGIDAADIMALAGLPDGVTPVGEPPSVSAPVQVMAPVTLPPVERLESGFRAVLMASRHMNEAELARELAEQLPTLFAVMQRPPTTARKPSAPDEAPEDDYPARRRA